jgi:hypothetical protein
VTAAAAHGRISSDAAQAGVLRHFPRLFASFGMAAADAQYLTADIVRLLEAGRPSLLDDIGDLLSMTRTGPQWGRLLAEARAPFLGRWIAPHALGGDVLDLLCGDGAVGTELFALTGQTVHLVEREGQCGVVPRPWGARIESLSEFRQRAHDLRFENVLLCTVLHHEVDPDAMLRLAARLSKRVILLENCVDDDYNPDYHLLVDAIFNCSLYRTRLPWPGQHFSAQDWLTRCATYGRARVIGHSSAVPGVPLSHSIIVLDVESHDGLPAGA